MKKRKDYDGGMFHTCHHLYRIRYFCQAAGSGTAFFMVWILGGICLLINGNPALRKGVFAETSMYMRVVLGGLLAAGVILFPCCGRADPWRLS